MRLRSHSAIKDKGLHSFLSPSKSVWLRYTKEQLVNAFVKATAQIRGTRLHALAASCIENKIIPAQSETDIQQQTLSMYVSDCVALGLTPEQPLFYTQNAFGTADAFGVFGNKLFIFDLKTGVHPASMDQLKCYAALFFLEYSLRPNDFQIELRIYQQGNVTICIPDAEDILSIMERYMWANEEIETLKEGGSLNELADTIL